MELQQIQVKSRDVDRWLVAISFLFFVLSTALVFDEGVFFKLLPRRTDVIVAAHVSEFQNDARHRLGGELVWLPLANKDDVYLGDSVFTGQESAISMRLENGSGISLDSETLVTLEKDAKQGASVALQWGSAMAHVVQGQVLQVKLGERVVKLRGDDAQIQLDGNLDGSTGISVQKGSVQIEGLGENSVINENQTLQVKGNEVIATTHEVELISPEANAVRWVQSSDAISFEWKAPQGENSGEFELIIARDKSFRHVLINQKIAASAIRGLRFPTSTRVYWKVKRGQSSSLVRSLTVRPDSAPNLVLPLDKEVIVAKKESVQKILMEWNDQLSNDFEYEVSSDEGFTNILDRGEVSAPTTVASLTGNGPFFWRVRARDARRESIAWSHVRSFSLTELKAESLSAPELDNPHLIFELMD